MIVGSNRKAGMKKATEKNPAMAPTRKFGEAECGLAALSIRLLPYSCCGLCHRIRLKRKAIAALGRSLQNLISDGHTTWSLDVEAWDLFPVIAPKHTVLGVSSATLP